MHVERLDHLVLTVQDIAATLAFYERVLGMRPISFGDGRKALAFGQSKINLHAAARPMHPHAHNPVAGSADLCLIVSTPIDAVVEHLRRCNVPVEAGPVQRTGALGPILSVYIRDPDRNLIELSRYKD